MHNAVVILDQRASTASVSQCIADLRDIGINTIYQLVPADCRELAGAPGDADGVVRVCCDGADAITRLYAGTDRSTLWVWTDPLLDPEAYRRLSCSPHPRAAVRAAEALTGVRLPVFASRHLVRRLRGADAQCVRTLLEEAAGERSTVWIPIGDLPGASSGTRHARLRVLLYAARNLHLPLLEPVAERLVRDYGAECVFCAPPYRPARHNSPGCGLDRCEHQRLAASYPVVDPQDVGPVDVAVVADANFYPVRQCPCIVNVGHGLISKGWFYTDSPVVRRENIADVICVPGPWHAQLLARHITSTVRTTGFIRTDAMSRVQPCDVARFRQRLGMADHARMVLFAPTFNPELSAVPCLGTDIARIASADTHLVIKLHGMTDESWVAQYRALAARHDTIHVIDDARYPTAMVAADLMISDVSSAFAEFMLLDKPIILFANARRHEYAAFNPDDIEYHLRTACTEVTSLESLALAVRLCLACPDEHAAQRREFARRLNVALDGRCAARAAAAVVETVRDTARRRSADRLISLIGWHADQRPPDRRWLQQLAAQAGAGVCCECGDIVRLEGAAICDAMQAAVGDTIVLLRQGSRLPAGWGRWLSNYFAWSDDAVAVRSLTEADNYRQLLGQALPAHACTSLDDVAEVCLHTLMGNDVSCEGLQDSDPCVAVRIDRLPPDWTQTLAPSHTPLVSLGAMILAARRRIVLAPEVFCHWSAPVPATAPQPPARAMQTHDAAPPAGGLSLPAAYARACQCRDDGEYDRAIELLEQVKQELLIKECS